MTRRMGITLREDYRLQGTRFLSLQKLHSPFSITESQSSLSFLPNSLPAPLVSQDAEDTALPLSLLNSPLEKALYQQSIPRQVRVGTKCLSSCPQALYQQSIPVRKETKRLLLPPPLLTSHPGQAGSEQIKVWSSKASRRSSISPHTRGRLR